MFSWLSKILTPKPTRTYMVPFRRVRGRYDAAVTNDDNRRHWANADLLSPDSANSPEVRRILRSRARYEIANNSYGQGMLLTLANDTIGTGPRLQLLTGDKNADIRIERAWMEWSKATSLAEKLRTMRVARAKDGEAFVVMLENDKLPTPIKLDLQLIECDRVANNEFSPVLDPNEVDGILYDNFGNPISYNILRYHPGDSFTTFLNESDRVSADFVLHWYRMDRPWQSRGIPDITPALPLFAQLRRYTLAVIAAAETAAEHSVFMESQAPPDDGLQEGRYPFESVEIEFRMMTTLPAGWKANQMRAEQPATTYEMFKREILNEIARCLNMPYNVAAANSASYNYASGRMDHQVYYKSIRVEQAQLEASHLDRIFSAWIFDAWKVGMLPGFDPGRTVTLPHQWFWDGQEHVDPSKEANAQDVRLNNRTTTYAYEYAKQGRDWEEAFRQIAKEQQFAKELGVELRPAKPGDTADEPQMEEIAED